MGQVHNRYFTIFRVTLTGVIFIESVLTVLDSLNSKTESHLGSVLPWFAGVEAVASLMLLLPRTAKFGAWLLLMIFAAAIIVHGPEKQMQLLVYAAGVVLIMSEPAYSRAG
jgi:uncharacterized membrane protein YphA (DoxX/SURF4 family)